MNKQSSVVCGSRRKGSGLAHAAVGYMSKYINGDDNQASHCQGREYNTEKEN